MTENLLQLDTIEKIVLASACFLKKQGYRLSSAEQALVSAHCIRKLSCNAGNLQTLIQNGVDPLGNAYCAARSEKDIKEYGAVYTPSHIVDSMLAWAHTENQNPARIVDSGAGTGRFILKAAKCFPNAALVGIE